MTATAVPPVVERLEVAWLDPRQLGEHPWNVRGDVGDITGLTASIAAQGILEPLVVVPFGIGNHQLVAGSRRRAAAIAADLELVPCIVRRDLAGKEDAEVAEQVAAMLAENIHRGSLTATEEARGVKLMLDLGVPISKVAKRTGLPLKDVKKAVGVARLDDATAAAVDLAQLDLDQAAAVAVFADEPDVAAGLVGAAARGPGSFAHELERAKQDRDRARRLEEKRAELLAAGRVLVDVAQWQGTKNRALDSLAGANQEMTTEEHKDCPGSAVAVEKGWEKGPRVTEVCCDPGKYGHRGRWESEKEIKPAQPSAEEAEASKAERRLVIENNKAMAAANATRRAWIRDFLARKTAPKTVLRFAVEELVINPSAIRGWFGSESAIEKDAADAMGLQPPVLSFYSPPEKRTTLTSGEQVTDARLPLQLLAHIAGALEQTIPKDAWRGADKRTADWLTFLAGEGYTLADVEQQIVDGAK